MAKGNGINGTSIVVVLTGTVFLYSGLKGKKISTTIRNFLAGKSPTGGPEPSLAITLPVSGDASAAGIGSPTGTAGFSGMIQSAGAGMTGIASALRQHFSVAQTAGILGNMQVESGFSPTANNPGEGAIGICQWEGGRRTNLQAFARARGTSETDLNTQLNFMLHEMQTTEVGAYMAVKASATPRAAALAFASLYERSASASWQQRQDIAAQIYTQLGGG